MRDTRKNKERSHPSKLKHERDLVNTQQRSYSTIKKKLLEHTVDAHVYLYVHVIYRALNCVLDATCFISGS